MEKAEAVKGLHRDADDAEPPDLLSALQALFYHELAAECPVPTPRCFFVDFTELTADFCLVSELVPFGTPAVSPLKHRVRDAPKLDELRRLVQMGGRLNCAFWGDAALKRGIRRFDATHRRASRRPTATASAREPGSDRYDGPARCRCPAFGRDRSAGRSCLRCGPLAPMLVKCNVFKFGAAKDCAAGSRE